MNLMFQFQRAAKRGNHEIGMVGAEEESVSVLAIENMEQRHDHNLEIEGETPVTEIVEVILHALRDRRIAAPAVYLGPARDSNLERVSGVVAIELVQKGLDEMGPF